MMNENTIYFGEHAVQRMAQRNLSKDEVLTVIRFGRKIYRTGVIFYFLGNRDIPKGKEKMLEKLVVPHYCPF